MMAADDGRRLRAIIDEHGPDAVALYVSGQMPIEAQYLATKLAKGFVQTVHIVGSAWPAQGRVVAKRYVRDVY
jgi:anaerobic selenocysteine-containing dehydrogenase